MTAKQEKLESILQSISVGLRDLIDMYPGSEGVQSLITQFNNLAFKLEVREIMEGFGRDIQTIQSDFEQTIKEMDNGQKHAG